MSGRLYTESEVLEIIKLVLKLDTSCLQFSQNMEQVFKMAEALNIALGRKHSGETSGSKKGGGSGQERL